jgi:cell division protein YceG involved in septum cleavage
MINNLGCQFLRFFALLFLILCVLVSSVFYVLDRPLDYFEIQDTDQYIFEVAKGSNLNQISGHLADQDLIVYPKLLKGLGACFKSTEY